LALRPDFNIEDAFRVFDINNEQVVSSADLKSGLALIGIYATHDEINLLMNRCDLN
jgi:Ca2+-binding EF-hand superfamily protein